MFVRGRRAVRVRAVGFYARPGLQLLTGLAMADKGFAVRRHHCQHPHCAVWQHRPPLHPSPWQENRKEFRCLKVLFEFDCVWRLVFIIHTFL